MGRLRERLVQLKVPNPQIAIVDSAPVHFHTKLFRFLNTGPQRGPFGSWDRQILAADAMSCWYAFRVIFSSR